MSDQKYDIHGRIVRVVAQTADGRFIVEQGHDEDGELYFSGDSINTLDRVFDEPPREAYHHEIAKLEARESELRGSIRALSQQLSAAERDHKARVAKFAKFDSLAMVEDFLDGKITHYVIVDSYSGESIRISEPNLEKCGNDKSYYAKLKLLVLYGDQKDRTPEWRLHYYSDGSGGSQDLVFPCTSLEAARIKAAELLDKAIAKVRKEPHGVHRLIQSATALGMPVPQDIAGLARAQTLKSARDELAKAQKEVANCVAKLAAVTQTQEATPA